MQQAYQPQGWKQAGSEILRSLHVPRGAYREEKPPPAKARWHYPQTCDEIPGNEAFSKKQRIYLKSAYTDVHVVVGFG